MKSILKSAAALGLVAIAGTTLLTGVDSLTRDRIAEQERRVLLEQLGQIIPEHYDNPILEDWIMFSDETHFPKQQKVLAYRARYQEKPVAVVLKFDATKGYNGNIALLVGIITLVIRRWGGYPDGVAFAVLLMNMAAPLIDRFTQPRKFGQ